ncbi:hypothetical protein J3R30DRAFT_3414047 [Lentinula aciculospora]|uniref:Uncharacterized protein n=1 Tax=Lentinula aciculospora TaxID=153920 RepID=A0A9W9DE12_9AGAR|nr:hypothetical protein J3R30DRAFT_3414047 [Lentinula aciculospora]
MFHHERPEKEYAPLFKKYSLETTVWSPLPRGSREDSKDCPLLKNWAQPPLPLTTAALALAWVMQKIEDILGNQPSSGMIYRPPLDLVLDVDFTQYRSSDT